MKYVLFLLTLVTLCGSCQEQPKEATVKKEEPIAAVKPADGSLCFQKKDGSSEMKLQFKVEEYKLTGSLVLLSEEGSLVTAVLSGKEIQGDFITDVHYVLGEKTYDEKIILNYDDQSASIARSGKIVVNGDRIDRNEGFGSLDVLNKVACQ